MDVTAPDEGAQTLLQRQFPQHEATRLVPEDVARRYCAIPVAINEGTLLIAIADPTDIFALEALTAQSGLRVEPHIGDPDEIRQAIDFNYRAYDEIEKKVSSISLPDEMIDTRIDPNAVSDAPVAQALTMIITEAAKARASDIHFQPEEEHLQIRYRIDGTLHDILTLPKPMAVPVISRMKIMANMNIADHHRTQDGQFTFTVSGRTLGIRVGTIPTVHGEMAVMRLLDRSQAKLDLADLGFLPECLETYQKLLRVPYGMILVSGPTGAGKTTTLYASINCLNHAEQNIVTIEDPVEYRFDHINQIQVNARAGITFSSGLRAILRLDPDVILVGEIRDAETAEIAVQGALTGHLVLSSIHANDSVNVVSRMFDLGIDPFLVSSALVGVVAQRMVRRVCGHCGKETPVPVMDSVAYAREMGEERTLFNQGPGCQACSDTGFQGRTGIFELLRVNDDIRELMLHRSDSVSLRACAIENGMVPLVKDGMLKAGAGITTPDEVLRNVMVAA